MKLSWGICARNRAWLKAIRRICPRLESLAETFARIQMKNPIHEAILVGIAEERTKDSFEEVPNSDGFYQVLVGFDTSIGLGSENDGELVFAVFHQLSRAILACPFSVPDHASVRAALDEWASANLKATE